MLLDQRRHHAFREHSSHQPDEFGIALEDFHKRMRERQARWPLALSASSTHDTKRSEDVRARINVLSEIPGEWKTKVSRWRRLNRRHRRETEDERFPDRNDEYMFYQTLIGAWPLDSLGDEEYRTFCGRIQRYMEKAIREAKVHTSWVNPNQTYDQAVQEFVQGALDRSSTNPFLEDFLPFQERIAHYGLFTGLAQLLLKMTASGVPDFYQGTELWSLVLVDPDNRGPVDYGLRAHLLDDLRHMMEAQNTERAQWVHGLSEQARDGRMKLYTTMAGLAFRKAHAALFQHGDYLPLECGGRKKQHLCAFARVHDQEAAVIVVPRLLATLTQDTKSPPLGPVWEDSWIAVPPWPTLGSYRHVLTGEVLATESLNGRRVLPLNQVFQHCPLGLLERLS